MSTDAKASKTTESPQLTLLLNRMQKGDRDAGDQAVALVYGELHRLASARMKRERPGNTLQTTALIHELYVRMVEVGGLEIQSRGHFFALASHQMRRILIDNARARDAKKRGGAAVKIELDHVQVGKEGRSIDLLALDEALGQLEHLAPRAAQVVELRFFGGYTDKEVAEALGISFAMARRDWAYASSWLFDRMRGADQNRPQESK